MEAKRAYNAPTRDDARLQTRRRIRQEATELFLRHGYAPTSLAAIGRAAGVSGRYVQMVFGSKAGLLTEAIQVAVVGDDSDRPLAGREDWTEMLKAGGQDTVRAFAQINAGIYQRCGLLLGVAATAAETDADLAALQARGQERRLRDCRSVTDRLQHDGWLYPDLTSAAAADTAYALSSPELYLVLHVQRGLPHQQYATWLSAALTGALAARGMKELQALPASC
jgi:AcrR family transcriptional regulator